MQSADYCEKEHPDTNMYPSSKRKESENTSPGKKITSKLLVIFRTPNRSNIELFPRRSGADLVPAGCHSGSKSDPLTTYDYGPFIIFLSKCLYLFL